MAHGIPAHFEVTEEVVKYLALGKLAGLGTEIANARKLSSTETKKVIKEASMIRLWIKALDYSEFITKEQRDKIKYALVDIASVNDFGVAPVLGTATRPSILLGGTTTVVNNNTGGDGEPFEWSDLSASSTVDSFAFSLSNGARWEYTIIKSDQTALVKGSISAGWLSDGSDITVGPELTGNSIGDTSDVVTDVDIDTGDVRFRLIISGGTWSVKGTRYLD